MLPEIKLTISQKDKLIETVTKSVDKQHLVKSLEEFQVEANAALTKMIEELCDIGETSGDGNLNDDEDEDGDDDADSSLSVSEERKGHSKSKKKKHS